MSLPVSINVATEGLVDLSVARRLIVHAGARSGFERRANGKHKLDPLIVKYRAAAAIGMPWLIVRDLDQDAPCAGALVDAISGSELPNFSFRVAVREIESWLIADAKGLATFLQVSEAKIDKAPELLLHPKRHVIDLARGSRSKAVRFGLVPDDRAGQQQGPEYAARLAEFASTHWNLARALDIGATPSLNKAVLRLKALVDRLSTA